ncbi:nucleoside deaminase [Nitrosomonas sp. Nm33]|uniref:nucleoside deaminase n=1 Tax=Nitrosomonas sp. Nm33 TaxID=133724 RepID=UPI000899DF56|nr:nucleoside deaminase [Nitrosomonas sp. Nm33]SDY10608.1 tRNA(Arg) A34 adenosine deaminase TadA [Nitrosomonas sp. Nm33]
MKEAQQIQFMLEAISLSAYGMIHNEGGPFGCVIVKNNSIIGRGSNKVILMNDPTAHAEIIAIRDACQHLGTFQLDGCQIYTSCEPCPMCLGAIYWAHPEKVYYACTRKDAAQIGFDDQFIYEEMMSDLPHRKIPMEQILRPESLKVFSGWLEKADKIIY